jgi:hypothetical protein
MALKRLERFLSHQTLAVVTALSFLLPTPHASATNLPREANSNCVNWLDNNKSSFIENTPINSFTQSTCNQSDQNNILKQALVKTFILLYPNYSLSFYDSCPIAPTTSGQLNENEAIAFYSVSARIPTIEIKLIKDVELNAYTKFSNYYPQRQAQIYLTDALLKEFSFASEIAFVLAHEMEHLERNLIVPDLDGFMLSTKQLERLKSIHEDWEYQADSAAIKKVLASGLNGKNAVSFLEKLTRRLHKHQHADEHKFLTMHPSLDLRIEALKDFNEKYELSQLKISDSSGQLTKSASLSHS